MSTIDTNFAYIIENMIIFFLSVRDSGNSVAHTIPSSVSQTLTLVCLSLQHRKGKTDKSGGHILDNRPVGKGLVFQREAG